MIQTRILSYKGEISTSSKKNDVIHNSELQLISVALPSTLIPKSSLEDSK